MVTLSIACDTVDFNINVVTTRWSHTQKVEIINSRAGGKYLSGAARRVRQTPVYRTPIELLALNTADQRDIDRMAGNGCQLTLSYLTASNGALRERFFMSKNIGFITTLSNSGGVKRVLYDTENNRTVSVKIISLTIKPRAKIRDENAAEIVLEWT